MDNEEQQVITSSVNTGVFDLSSLDTWEEWVAYIVLLLIPVFISYFITFGIVKMVHKGYISTNNKRWPSMRGYWTACPIGFVVGVWVIWALQELGSMLLGVPNITLKVIINMGVFIGVSNPLAYDWIRDAGTTTKRNWLRALAKSISVKPVRTADNLGVKNTEGTITQTLFSNPTEEDSNDR